MQASRVWTSIWCNAVTRTSSRNYGGGHVRQPTMNDMPVPQGDFMFHHAARQRGHNLVLALGACSLGFGLFLYNATDIVKFHFSPPSTYE